MASIKYRDIYEIEQLRRRIESLEDKCSFLYEEYTTMRNVLKAKHSFLDFKFSQKPFLHTETRTEMEEIEDDLFDIGL